MSHLDSGFSDVMYDLVSVQYHALTAGDTYEKYVNDAEQAGKSDVADFFRQIQTQDAERAHRCHELLAEYTTTTTD